MAVLLANDYWYIYRSTACMCRVMLSIATWYHSHINISIYEFRREKVKKGKLNQQKLFKHSYFKRARYECETYLFPENSFACNFPGKTYITSFTIVRRFIFISSMPYNINILLFQLIQDLLTLPHASHHTRPEKDRQLKLEKVVFKAEKQNRFEKQNFCFSTAAVKIYHNYFTICFV